MLVLTRKIDQSIIIGDNIKLIVVEIRGDQVKIGIEAPRDVTVHREEVYREIKEENKRAALRSSLNIEDVNRLLKKPINDSKE
ncbi:MAG: carbon storage regulator CsrA [Firmicutes bacterium]|nr:carbon storage regulator CsrA [Bacillota bacterium]